MTKSIRIENADNNQSVSLVVQDQVRDADGNWIDTGSPRDLIWPCAMETVGIHDGKRVIVSEKPNPYAPKT